MNNNFDFDFAASAAEDAVNLIAAVETLLDPLTDTGRPDAADLYELTARAKMIETTLRTARNKAQDVVHQFQRATVLSSISA